MNSQDRGNHTIKPSAGTQPIPHPLAAGLAWSGLMAAIGVVYLLVQSLWQRAASGAGNVPLASSDQQWSLALVAATGFAIGATLAATRRRRRRSAAGSEPC
jgi:hypothetical protein